MEIDVQEAMVDPKILNAVKQALHFLHRKFKRLNDQHVKCDVYLKRKSK